MYEYTNGYVYWIRIKNNHGFNAFRCSFHLKFSVAQKKVQKFYTKARQLGWDVNDIEVYNLKNGSKLELNEIRSNGKKITRPGEKLHQELYCTIIT